MAEVNANAVGANHIKPKIMKRTIITLSILLLASIGINIYQCKTNKESSKEATTTAVRYDTIAYHPTTAKDSIYIKTDTVILNANINKSLAKNENEITLESVDSNKVKLNVPIEKKRYEDSTYTAWISGYHARMDSIHVRQRTITVTNTIIKNKIKRFGVGVQAGIGMTPKGVQPYVGFGAHINIW